MANNNFGGQQTAMERQLIGKDFWHPDASRKEAESFLKNAKPGAFMIRRSSNVGYLALSHRLDDGGFGHALIMWDGSGYTLENANKSYSVIEQLIKSLNLNLKNVKKQRPRPAMALGHPVMFQVECLCTYHARSEHELSAERADIVNVIGAEPGYYYGELDGQHGRIPSGLCKMVPGTDQLPPGVSPPLAGGGVLSPQFQKMEQLQAAQREAQAAAAATAAAAAAHPNGYAGGGFQRPPNVKGDYMDPANLDLRDPSLVGGTAAVMPSAASLNQLGQMKSRQAQIYNDVQRVEYQLHSERDPSRQVALRDQLQRLRAEGHELDTAIQAVDGERRMSMMYGTQGGAAMPSRGNSQVFSSSGRSGTTSGKVERKGYNPAMLQQDGEECQAEEVRAKEKYGYSIPAAPPFGGVSMRR